MIQAYLLYFDTSITKLQAEIIQLNNYTSEILNSDLNTQLVSKGYEFIDYSDDFAILVDENGFYKPGNPIFEVETMFGNTIRLAGRLLFVRNEYNEFSTDIGSIKKEDIFNFRINLKIKLIGFLDTRNLMN